MGKIFAFTKLLKNLERHIFLSLLIYVQSILILCLLTCKGQQKSQKMGVDNAECIHSFIHSLGS